MAQKLFYSVLLTAILVLVKCDLLSVNYLKPLSAMAGVDGDYRKRSLEHVDTSPTGVTPPHSRQKADDSDFTLKLITALSDPRVVHALTGILVKPLLDQLESKDQQINDLSEKVSDLKAEVTNLKDAVDELEQYGRRNAVRIWSKTMPESPGENTDDLVKAYARKAGVELPPDSIGRSHRVGRPAPNKVRPIIVKFISYNLRKTLYDARKNVPGVYVSEDLTSVRSSILYKARLERTAGRFKHCWTTDGRINIRLPDDSKHVITTQTQLDQLIDDHPLPSVRHPSD